MRHTIRVSPLQISPRCCDSIATRTDFNWLSLIFSKSTSTSAGVCNYFLYFLTPTSILCKESGSWEHYYEKQLINWAKNAFWTIFRTIMHELREERSNNRNKHLSPRVYLNQYIRFPHKTLHHEQNVRDEQFVQDQGLMEIFIEAPHSLPASW